MIVTFHMPLFSNSNFLTCLMTRVHDCVRVIRHSCLAERSTIQKSLGGEKADFVVGQKSFKRKLPIFVFLISDKPFQYCDVKVLLKT